MSIRNYAAITDLDELRTTIDRVYGDIFGFDIETGYTGDDREKGAVHPETAMVVGFSFTNSTDWARYVPLAHDTGENLTDHRAVAELLWVLLSTGLGVAHNAAFELRHLSRWFLALLGDHPEHGEAVRRTGGYFPIRSDTQVEAYLVAEVERFGLKSLTSLLFDRLGNPVPSEQLRHRAARLAELTKAFRTSDEPDLRGYLGARFDGHLMTELYELFTNLAMNRRKYLRFNTLEITPQVVEYACEDSVWCLAIHRRYYELVKDRLLYKVEMAVVESCLPPMEDHGVLYDWATMRRTADELRLFRDKFNAEIMIELSELTGETIALNLASPPQISDVLFTKLGYRTTVYTDKTRDLPQAERKMSTGSIALTKLAQQYPVVKKILQWKEMTRLLGTYLDKYEAAYGYADDGRCHPSHLSAFVVTGRFAVADPPYQQSPKKYHFDLAAARAAHAAGEEPPPGTCFRFNFRDCIIAPPDHYGLGFDLSQAELRAIAGEAQETALLRAFEQGDDVHRLTASLMLGVPLDEITSEQRDIGKTMNFALLYGMGVKSLADRLGIPIEEAQSLMDKYFAGYANIATWSARQVEHGQRHGYVTSRFGRRLPIWEYHSDKHYIRQKGDRACVNYPIQGAATGDYMKIAMVRAQAAIKAAGLDDKIHLVMNIHDALEFYVHTSVEPQDAIAVLKDAVVFAVPGWPAMKADWHLFKKWGSPMEIEIRDDGSLSVKGDKVYELAPSVEVDEETGEKIETMPEVDPAALHRAAVSSTDEPEHRQVIVTLTDMPVGDAWRTFVQLARTTSGGNAVTVSTPEGDVDLPFTTGLGPDDLAAISRALGSDVTVTFAATEADTAAMLAGMQW